MCFAAQALGQRPADERNGYLLASSSNIRARIAQSERDADTLEVGRSWLMFGTCNCWFISLYHKKMLLILFYQ